MRAEDTSTKRKHRKLRDILVSEKVSSVLDWTKTSIRTPTFASVGNKVQAQRAQALPKEYELSR